MTDPIVVVGAGPAGLSAAHYLADFDVMVLERDDEPGGLCRSFELDGAVFDLGGHAFFTRHDEVRALVEQLCACGVHSQPRQAWVWSHDRFVRYPFQSHLHGLPAAVVTDCIVGLIDVAKGGDATVTSLADWIDGTFGRGIRDHFLGPYNEKVWAYPLEEIAPTWTGDRIVTPDVAQIVRGALEPRHDNSYVNAHVSYPATGGFWGLYAGFRDAIGDRIRCSCPVARIDIATRRLWLEDGEEIRYARLISTLPLDQLVARSTGIGACCREAANELRHNSLHLVNIVADSAGMTDKQRIYVADPDIPFHKLVLNSNSSPSLRERPTFAIQAEVSFSPKKPVALEGLADRVVDIVATMGVVKRAAVRTVQTRTVAYAYPVYTSTTAQVRAHLLDTYRSHGIACAGRFGEWLYINSDVAVLRGQAAAQAVTSDLGTRA